ncbi:MAG: hypothetical protein ACKO5K_01380 [Armatimonadota bacterium]
MIHVEKPAGRMVGVEIVPHTIAPEMRWFEPNGPGPAAKVTLYVEGAARPLRFAGHSPKDLLASGDWAWHDMGEGVAGEPGTLSVWTFNGKSERWGVGNTFTVDADGLDPQTVRIDAPERWISAVTFLATGDVLKPDRVVVHLANAGKSGFRATKVRFWLPVAKGAWRTFRPGPWIKAAASVPAGDRGVLDLRVPALPLGYAVVEVSTSAGSLRSHVRVKSEHFAISGGWINNEGSEAPTTEAYLRLLCSLHIDTAHYQELRGYSDRPELVRKYPLRRFNKLDPIEKYDTDALLPAVHGVEFLGEPQYGGGRPVPPQEVFDKLLPYRSTRLPTTVTHSEERIWRWYAGLSDFPHYDAYRVTAPAADSWRRYDRWNGKRIAWGSPLETIGVLGRSLRDLNRPFPCAYWSQGPHEGWDDYWDGRKRCSPNAFEVRAQAVHALASRITSLYWFNLSLNSLMLFPDTWDAMRRVGREIRMLEALYLEGDGSSFVRVEGRGGAPDWELSVVAGPRGAVCHAIDTAYGIDVENKEFVSGAERAATFAFVLPQYLRRPVDVFRVDADGVHSVKWTATGDGFRVEDRRSGDAIYVASKLKTLRADIEARRADALKQEAAHPVDETALRTFWDGERARKGRR